MVATSQSVVYITGASRGIGRLLASSLSRDGMLVVGFARSSHDLRTSSSQSDTSRIHAYPLDVSDADAVRTAFARAVDEVGAPTTLITCAGSIDALGPIATVDPERWWKALAVDLRGTMLCAQAALTTMLPSGLGRVITMYGNLGDDGREHVSAFAAAKAGVARFTETLAAELEGTGVIATCIHPGFVRTDMTEHLASSEAGMRWLPDFGQRAADRWGDGASAVALVRRVIAGEADALAGRVVYVGDDLADVARSAAADPGDRRLRIRGGR